MAIVHIRVGNREYDVACDDGQEDHLRLLADEVDERVRSVMFSMGTNVGDNMALLMSALTMADDLIESKREIQNIAAEVNHLSHQLDAGTQQRQLAEMEQAMAHTLEEIAGRIEKIADQLEIQ
jgi:cell division protein ZapA